MRRVKIYAGIILLLIFNNSGLAQQLRLGSNPYTVEKSAVLELVSNNQGLLLPRITDTTLINTLTPPDGMMIYFVPAKKLFLRTNGSWTGITTVDSVVTSVNGNMGALTLDTTYISNFHSKVKSLFSASAPITLSGGQIGISQATTSTNGYLSSTDWNTFNNKQAAGNYLTDPGANGIVARTSLNTTTNRTIAGTSNRITLSDGDGVSGNPTIDISSSYVGQNSITTLGTIGTGTWNGTTIEAGYGGTGISSYTTGDILYASGTTTLSKLAGVATGNALISGGVSTSPSWGKIGLTTHVSGVLPITNGGTNSSASLNNDRIMVSSGGSITEAAALTDGQLLIGSTGNAPTAATLTAGYGISVTNGSGSVTITNTSPAYRTLVTTTSDFTLNYKDTLSNIPGLSFTATAGVLYRFQIIFVHENIGGTGDYVDYALNGPALTYMGALFAMGKSATTFEFGAVNAYNATTTAGNVLVGTNIVRIDGMIKTSSTGTVIFRAMPKNANKGSIKAGASLEYW